MKLIYAQSEAAWQLRFEDFHGVNDLGDQVPVPQVFALSLSERLH